MGRPPSSGGPAFRFTHAEVAEMEEHLRHLNNAIPQRNVIQGLAEKFTASAARAGKIPVQYKQVWNWFQNRRYSQRARTPRGAPPPQGKMLPTGAEEHHPASFRAQGYDVAAFLSHRLFETGDPDFIIVPARSIHNQSLAASLPHSQQKAGAFLSQRALLHYAAACGLEKQAHLLQNLVPREDPDSYTFAARLVSRLEYGLRREKQTVDDLMWLVKLEVKVRFSGFGPEEDEWINVRKCVRLRSLPCESAECVAVLPGDLILCFQEGKEQALYFDARVLDAQRRRHDVRGCRCRFLVRYDHDHSEEIVPLRKVCRRPETDFRLQILHASRAAASADAQNVSPVEQKPQKAHKMMDVNTAEVTVVCNPDQGGPSDKPAAPLPAAAAGTRGDSVSDVQMGNVEVIPKVEAANEAHDDKMNVGA
ncbi:unnamed protein product [Triticum turgidum subsp. durum]|uniref:Homeobox domain-containing protein n=1 Tax=Triticum turgidum subsp. durum TaxID=4567 RepID=A0A9R0ZBJ1_TRITD|nr:unnamed protein product [Triticum turgidum subsp. durum]